MSYPLKDLTGQRFGLVVVVDRAESKPYGAGQRGTKKRTRWNVICDCGAPRVMLASNLRGQGVRTHKMCGARGELREALTEHGLQPSEAPAPDKKTGRGWAFVLCVFALFGCGEQVYPTTQLRPAGVPAEFVERARDRWETATGVRLEVSAESGAPVGYGAELEGDMLDCRTPDEIAEGVAPLPCAGRTVMNVKRRADAWWADSVTVWAGARDHECRTLNALMHELGHVIAEDDTREHPSEFGEVMSLHQDQFSDECMALDAESVAWVCETAACTRFQTEEE